ncbi:MAG: UbiA prenyltransferase family protein [Verrucomicrobiota bacterium]|nr:UbiA prenyltransferase family protein [Verrucomicrobiota bacterium]
MKNPTQRLMPYARLARPDNWFKNIFVLPGIILVFFFDPAIITPAAWLNVALGLAAVCLIASSYYVLNEILDAQTDRRHPEKSGRPIPSGQARLPAAWTEHAVLAVAGMGLAFWVNPRFGFVAFALWIVAALYNVPPVRLKDLSYGDVLSEAVNNSLRLALGWYATGCELLPPLTALLAYWMFGAFLMAVKRFAEYRRIGDADAAAQYRKSFQHYTDERLQESILFYAALFGMFSGAFIARYRIELVLATPLVALAMAYYLHLGHKPNSPAQYPERLWRQKKLMVLVALAFGACVALFFIDIPAFRELITPTIIRR